ncbi:CDP-glucose 4,6-dehydratase [Paenibacillus aestuarii]|uniref:CDP-glucose 4,6-dehydratase n=1 Tax=Paenibacillus aestuarii TaxID=516965 RepID=A0ABW0K688_9BACL|nr:CDP-glucose 4,6-dehydratase [Paenibacillus aestuarii]
MSFWYGKRVLITGHTGFKGSWLSLWLQRMGAEVVGYSAAPPTIPNMYSQVRVGDHMMSIYGDIRDLQQLQDTIRRYDPEIIFHLAAQSLVRESYLNPLETFSTNIMGTVNLFEASRSANNLRVLINVTSDKCYENNEWSRGYRESDPMGGHDPYSASKGCAELITSSYRRSYFSQGEHSHHISVSSVRAGNVIGGGDWAKDRLIPDIIRSIQSRQPLLIRNPSAIRPWQHVLEPINGYLLLAQKMWEHGTVFGDAWNFGPNEGDALSVSSLLEIFSRTWDEKLSVHVCEGTHNPHEAGLLNLDCSKATHQLGWRPYLPVRNAVEWLTNWYRAYFQEEDLRETTIKQIARYEEIIKESNL